MRAAFPRQKFDQETARIYVAQILDLNADIAMKAVTSLIRTSEFFPTIAEIREEHKRFWETRERPRELEPPSMDPTEREKFAGMMRGWVDETFGAVQGFKSVFDGLEERPSGRCDDCGDPDCRLRWRYGKFTVCAGCVSLRRRAGARARR